MTGGEGLFCDDRDIRRQSREAGDNDFLRGRVCFRDGAVVVLVLGDEILSVNTHDGVARIDGERFEFGEQFFGSGHLAS